VDERFPREGNGAIKRKSKKNREMTHKHHNRASEISQMEFGSGSVSDIAGNYPEKWATSSKGTSRESARFHFSGKRVNQALGVNQMSIQSGLLQFLCVDLANQQRNGFV
jgi:hypothetical protein